MEKRAVVLLGTYWTTRKRAVENCRWKNRLWKMGVEKFVVIETPRGFMVVGRSLISKLKQ